MLQLNSGMKELLCCICIEGPEEGDKWFLPPCSELHMMHLECYELSSKYAKDNNKIFYCPHCRAEIRENTGKIKEIAEQ
jgi:hypothetical protein